MQAGTAQADTVLADKPFDKPSQDSAEEAAEEDDGGTNHQDSAESDHGSAGISNVRCIANKDHIDFQAPLHEHQAPLHDHQAPLHELHDIAADKATPTRGSAGSLF